MSKVDPNKITPEQKKFINSQLGTSSVSTQQEIAAVGNSALENTLRRQNEEAINSLSPEAQQRLSLDQATGSFQRGPADNTDPILLVCERIACFEQINTNHHRSR